ncbi:MAG: hypothetical protein KF861_13980 [Planctomycetaceae bacterium]|nr:hypothetical protein [Planctomycetaceae bacterium]
MKLTRHGCCVWMIGLCVLMGCGGKGDRPKLGTVTGTVSMDDQPLPNVWVFFNPTGGGRTSMGRTDEYGTYELMYLEGAKGANLGSHQVVIMTYHEDEIEEMKLNTGKPVIDPIPARYNSKSELTAEVKEGKNVLDFPLKSQ